MAYSHPNPRKKIRMKVLVASRYVDPDYASGNNNVTMQVKSLQSDFDIDAEILTWPFNDHWSGPMPHADLQDPPLRVIRSEVTYHVFTAPVTWNEGANGNTIRAVDWDTAVAYGKLLLTRLKPDIVHLHHRHGMWWILESAQQLGIKTIYTNHDWGLFCLRTLLINGNGEQCDGVLTPQKCAACVLKSRSPLGRLIEKSTQFAIGRQLWRLLKSAWFLSPSRRQYIAVESVNIRTKLHQNRVRSVLARLDHLITPSRFGQKVFEMAGVPANKTLVLPWYYDRAIAQAFKKEAPESFTLCYLGRVSPEKGLNVVLEALESIKTGPPIKLIVGGSIDNKFALNLKRKYSSAAGIHTVVWAGFSNPSAIFKNAHAFVCAGRGIDNSPLSVIEALATNTPVVAFQTPPLVELLTEGSTGFFAAGTTAASFAQALERAHHAYRTTQFKDTVFQNIDTLQEYLAKIVTAYEQLLSNSSARSLSSCQ